MINIENTIISKKSKIYTIAEIGVNHNGLINNAIKMINFANEAGFNAVKFQTYDVNEMLTDRANLANYQKKTKFQNMKSMLKKYSLTFDQFNKLKAYCKRKRITFLSTPFDVKSAIFLNKINVSAFKISSGDLNNFHLLSKIKKFNKPIILSTGMAVEKNVVETINFLKLSKKRLAVLHCVSDYPTKIENSFLSNINHLKKLGYIVGFSDHTIGDVVSCSAVSLGAKILEKHITLNKNMNGPDHKSSMECKNLKEFIFKVQAINKSISYKKRKLTKEEFITQKVAKKSLYFSKNLEDNHVINFEDIVPLRPVENGISPEKFRHFIGKKIKRKVKKFTLVKNKYFYE